MSIPTLLARLNQLDHQKTQLDAYRPLFGERLQHALDLEYTYESNRIEGNTLTLRETDLVVNKGLTIGGKSMREHLEAINHNEAVSLIREWSTVCQPVTLAMVNTLHALVLHGIDRHNAGRYRTVAVGIAGSQHIPPAPWQVADLMRDYGEWLTHAYTALHPVLYAAEAHERLVTIHPYIDGNGRTSRLVMNLILLQHGYPVANLRGDVASRLAYYDALETVNVTGNKTPFLAWIVQAVETSIADILQRLAQ